jgi:hypothetical protein
MTDNFTAPTTFAANSEITAAGHNDNWTELENYLNPRFGSAASAQIWVANASGVATPRTISGDATVDNAGALTIGADKITNSKILNGTIADSKLVTSPATLAAAYREIFRGEKFINGSGSFSGGGRFLIGSGGQYDERLPDALADAVSISVLRLEAADYPAPTGKVAKLRVRAQAICGGNANPVSTFTVGLHQLVNPTTGTDNTLGYDVNNSAVAGSTVAFTGLTRPSKNEGDSSDFDLPTDDYYCLVVDLSGGPAANSAVVIAAQLQVHHV